MQGARRSWVVAVLVISLVLGSSGCATIVRGKQARVEIQSLPSGATVWVDGQLRGKTPLEVTLSREELHSIRFTLDGHEEVTIQTDRKISADLLAFDILLTLLVVGWVALVVDGATGAWYEPGPGPLRVLLSPKGQQCATGECAYLRAAKEAARP